MYFCTRIEKVVVRESLDKGPEEGTRREVYSEPVTQYGKQSMRLLLEWLEHSCGVPILAAFTVQGRSAFDVVVVRRLEVENGSLANDDHKRRWREGGMVLYTAEFTFKIEKRVSAPVFIEDYAGLMFDREVLPPAKRKEG